MIAPAMIILTMIVLAMMVVAAPGAVRSVRFAANIRRSHRHGLIPARFRQSKRPLSMIPKSGNRFSEKIMLKQ
jgi:hypothetical protein